MQALVSLSNIFAHQSWLILFQLKCIFPPQEGEIPPLYINDFFPPEHRTAPEFDSSRSATFETDAILSRGIDKLAFVRAMSYLRPRKPNWVSSTFLFGGFFFFAIPFLQNWIPNRDALWKTGYSTNGALYNLTVSLNTLRNYNQQSVRDQQMYLDKSTYATALLPWRIIYLVEGELRKA
jgi:hypothetical protein